MSQNVYSKTFDHRPVVAAGPPSQVINAFKPGSLNAEQPAGLMVAKVAGLIEPFDNGGAGGLEVLFGVTVALFAGGDVTVNIMQQGRVNPDFVYEDAAAAAVTTDTVASDPTKIPALEALTIFVQ